FQQVQAAVLRECIVNLARIKEAVTQSVGGTLDAAGLDSWQDLMRGIKAGLPLLGKPRAVEIIDAITAQLRRVMQTGVHVLPPGAARHAAPAEPADPELLKLFIEEAQEELTRIQHCFPAWDHNPLERDSLVTVRRSFHTLKGSGRMVGARELSEFAWAIENLLNRLLDHTLSRTPPILEALRAAVGALPELITQLQTREPLRTDVSAIAARAHA